MYSGTTLRTKSGRIMGAHQKIDRIARRSVRSVLPPGCTFPEISEILHFEGKNGPDGIKSKSPGIDEPWHYIDPTAPDDRHIFDLTRDHSYNLTKALEANDMVRAAFEAAWLAHAIVDGLTPAHHFPLADTIEELWGKPHDERMTKRDKSIIRGDSRRDTLKKNWQYWGAKGVFTTHYMFEWGFASTITPLRFSDFRLDKGEIARVEREGFTAVFEETIHDIYNLKMYEEYYKRGWTRRLARQSRETLAPAIINIVALAWYDAAYQVGKTKQA